MKMYYFTGIIFYALCLAGCRRSDVQLSDRRVTQTEGRQKLANIIGPCTLSGTLNLGFPLGELQLPNKTQVRFVLQHTLESKCDGTVWSNWHVVGLTTSIMRSGSKRWRFSALNGEEIYFPDSRALTDSTGQNAAEYNIRRTGECDFEVRDKLRTLYKYINGSLTYIEIPGNEKYTVVSTGGLIRAICSARDDKPLVQVEYDDDMRIRCIQTSTAGTAKLIWSSTGMLESLKRGNYGAVFRYDSRNLLNCIWDSRNTTAVEWRQNRRWQDFGSRWPAPMHVARFGKIYYELNIRESGRVFDIENVNRKYQVIYNPLTNKVSLAGDSEHVSFLLR